MLLSTDAGEPARRLIGQAIRLNRASSDLPAEVNGGNTSSPFAAANALSVSSNVSSRVAADNRVEARMATSIDPTFTLGA